MGNIILIIKKEMKHVFIPIMSLSFTPIHSYWGWWINTEYCDYNKNTFLDSTKLIDSQDSCLEFCGASADANFYHSDDMSYEVDLCCDYDQLTEGSLITHQCNLFIGKEVIDYTGDVCYNKDAGDETLVDMHGDKCVNYVGNSEWCG